MKYIIYTRKSMEDEDRQILSIKAQLAELRELAVKEKLKLSLPFRKQKLPMNLKKHWLEPHFGKKILNILCQKFR